MDFWKCSTRISRREKTYKIKFLQKNGVNVINRIDDNIQTKQPGLNMIR